MAPLCNICRRTFGIILGRNSPLSYRLISTSGKRKDAGTDKSCAPSESNLKKIPDFSKPNGNFWLSDNQDIEEERSLRMLMHVTFFCVITGILGGVLFIGYFSPNRMNLDWARREAFLRLHERESMGLDPIDPNYIDPSKIILPPDEELSDEDIVV